MTAMIEKLTPSTLRQLKEEYSDPPGYLDIEDSGITFRNNFNSLPEPERIILMIYADVASERETAKLLGVSRTTIRKLLKKIKEEMKKDLC